MASTKRWRSVPSSCTLLELSESLVFSMPLSATTLERSATLCTGQERSCFGDKTVSGTYPACCCCILFMDLPITSERQLSLLQAKSSTTITESFASARSEEHTSELQSL